MRGEKILMRVRYQPEITCPNGRELYVLIHQQEVFTPESLIIEGEALRKQFGVTVNVRADKYNVGFRIRSYDDDVRSMGIGQHEFDYAVDAEPETPEVMFASSKGGALDPRQPLSAYTVTEFLSELSEPHYEWGVSYDEPYLWVRSGSSVLDRQGSVIERQLNPKYKRGRVGLTVTVRHSYVDTMTMWVEAADTPAFNQEAAEALVFVTDFRQKDHQATARLSGKPWLGQFSSFLSDFLNKDSAWKFTLQFAHALGYHPMENKFTIIFDERHSMTFVPPAVSYRS